MTLAYLEGAAPLFFPGNRIGCLCLHGIMDVPFQQLWLAQYLHARGYTVHAPRLSGHGTDPHHMRRQHWEDWLASALDGYHLLKQTCDTVVVVGFSMGGTLGALLATYVEVGALAVLASPIQFTDWGARNTFWLRYLRPYTYRPSYPEILNTVREEQARRGEPVVGRVRYDLWATAAVWQLVKLTRQTYVRLPELHAPLLLIYSEQDPTVSLAHSDIFLQKAGSVIKERHILTQSGHILVQDVEREIVFEKIAAFIRDYPAK